MPTTLLIAGPTGLIGDTTLRMALDDDRVGRVIALTRKPLDLQHPKLLEWCHDDILQVLGKQPVDAVLCCLGTTMRQVGGDKAKFIHVDKDLVLGLGRWARDVGVPVFAVVSAVGADPRSAFFYNRVKGEMERGLRAMGFPTLHIFHPSILTGPRKQQRFGESIGIVLGRLFAPLLPERYRPMPHDMLAKALLNSAFIPQGGTRTYKAIRNIVRLRS